MICLKNFQDLPDLQKLCQKPGDILGGGTAAGLRRVRRAACGERRVGGGSPKSPRAAERWEADGNKNMQKPSRAIKRMNFQSTIYKG